MARLQLCRAGSNTSYGLDQQQQLIIANMAVLAVTLLCEDDDDATIGRPSASTRRDDFVQ